MLNYLNREFLKNWMELLGDKISQKRLLDIKSPGSHNSNSYTLEGGIITKFAKTQEKDIKTQLELGIRLLDLRYGPNKKNDKLVDQHGPVKGGNFENNFIQIKNYLNKYKKEFLIIKIQAEEKISSGVKKDFLDFLEKTLGSFLIKKNDVDSWFNLETVKMEDIWKTEKRILFFFHPYKVYFHNCEDKGIFSDKEKIQSHWHDVMDKKKLFKSNLEQIDKRIKNEGNYMNKIFINQFIMTLQKKIGTIILKFISFNPPTIKNFAEKIIKRNRIHFFLLDNKSKPFNYFLYDFVNLDLNVLLITISLNLDSDLKVTKGWISGLDISEEIHKYIFNNNCLFIYNMRGFKEKYKEKKNLSILYNFDNQDRAFSTEKLKNHVFIFDNPLIKKQFFELKSFSILISKKLLKIDYDYQNDKEFKNKVEKKFMGPKFKAGFCFFENRIVFYKS